MKTAFESLIPIPVIAGELIYYHDGTNNSDSASFKAVDALDAESAAGVETITMVANGGWAVLAVPFGGPPTLLSVKATEVDALALVASWEAVHSGQAESAELKTTTAFTLLARGVDSYVQEALGSPYALKDAVRVLEIQRALVPILTDGSHAALLAKVNTYGGLMTVEGATGLTPAQQREWDTIVDATNTAHLRRSYIPIDDFGGALEELKGTLA